MNLLQKASMSRLQAEFGIQAGMDTVLFSSNARFSSNIQPSEATVPNDMNKQMAGNSANSMSDASLAQIRSYRQYKTKEKEKKALEKKRKALSPVMPESLKKDIRRAKTIKQDDISPTV